MNLRTLYLSVFLTIHYSLFTIHCFSQERLGICNSLYSGINGVWINPSNIAGCPFKIDVNIISFQNFINNNFVYLYKANIPTLLSKSSFSNINLNAKITVDNTYNINHGITSKIMLYNNNSSNEKDVYQNLLVQGPSVLISCKDWGFAFISNFREGLSAINVNSKLAKFVFEGMSYTPLSNQNIAIPAFRINAAAWMELGFSAAKIIKKDKDKIIKAGITYKYLLPFADVYLNNKSLTINYPNDKDLIFYSVNADYGHALPTSQPQVLGNGQSVDLGFSYSKYLVPKLKENNKYNYEQGDGCPNNCKPNPFLLYKWKLGFSLLDIGYLNFNNKAESYVFNNASLETWTNFTNWSPKSLDNLDQTLNEHFNNNPLAPPDKTQYTVLMPMAASATYDLQLLTPGFYVNATLVQRLPHFNTPGIDRENLFSITPRYDYTYFGVAIPLILYDYTYPLIGLCFRFGNNLVIGTDKLGCFLGNKLTGMDIYFSLKFNLMNKCKKPVIINNDI